MISNLSTRIARLEAAQAPPVALETTFSPALRLLRLLLAAHLGDLRSGEPVAAGEARALGYGTAAEMNAAMVTARTAIIGWGSKHNMVMMEMLDQRGGGSSVGMAANRTAIAALLAGLPGTFADHPDADPDQIDAATEWVSL